MFVRNEDVGNSTNRGRREAVFLAGGGGRLVNLVRLTLDREDSLVNGNARKKRKTNTYVVGNALLRLALEFTSTLPAGIKSGVPGGD